MNEQDRQRLENLHIQDPVKVGDEGWHYSQLTQAANLRIAEIKGESLTVWIMNPKNSLDDGDFIVRKSGFIKSGWKFYKGF